MKSNSFRKNLLLLLIILLFALLITDNVLAGNSSGQQVKEELAAAKIDANEEKSKESRCNSTFKNPFASWGADPWVIFHEGFYYYCYATTTKIWVKKASCLQDIFEVDKSLIWQSPPNKPYSSHIWAPELHYLDNKWYVYFAADDGHNVNHRMYVLEGKSQDPQGEYVLKGKIASPSDRWAIDGTVLVMPSGDKYFIWSGWQGSKDIQQNLYIAPMSNPWTISGKRILISTPEYDWEKKGGTPLVNEGPQILKKENRLFIIYSASGAWSDDYCLGQLILIGKDVLNKNSWVKKKTSVFASTSSVIGPGHASFTISPDGKEDWIVYHVHKYKGSGWKRDVRIQRFEWDSKGHPYFGEPVSVETELKAPSAKLGNENNEESEIDKNEKLSAEQYEKIQQHIKAIKSGSICGIGVNIGKVEGGIIIRKVIAEPAKEARLVAGDIIIAVEGKSTVGIAIQKAVGMITGPEGSTVRLTIRNAQGQTHVVDVTRAKITITCVDSRVLDNNFGLIQVGCVNNNTVAAVKQILDEFGQQKITGIVLDLRGNRNGLDRQIIELADIFIPAQKTLWLSQKTGGEYERVKSNTAALTSLPVAVLIDGKSGGCGELLAAAFKRTRRGILIGHKTSGEASIKKFVEKPDGTAEKVIIGKLFIQPDVPISVKGILPNIKMPADATPEQFIEKAVQVLQKRNPLR